METVVRAQAMSVPDPQSASEKLVASDGSKPHLLYKCLLNQYAQKMRKPPPIFETQNEGFHHLPKFRSTVLIDGLRYTSSNTFQQRKMAEMDVSKIAYTAIMQKSKDDALHFIREDKTLGKSILAEYAAKINITKPIYETSQMQTLLVFRSTVVFNGVTYSGEISKSKKEAEQSAARTVILKYLESKSANDMAEIINCKPKPYVELNKLLEINNFKIGSHDNPTVPATCPSAGVTQPPIPRVAANAITPAAPVVTQPPIPNVSVDAIAPAVPVVTQPPIPNVKTETIVLDDPIEIHPPILNISTEAIAPAVPALTEISMASVPESSNVIQPANAGTSRGTIFPPLPLASQAPEHILVMGQTPGQTSGRKRNKNNKRRARKKMRAADAMMASTVPTVEVSPCSAT